MPAKSALKIRSGKRLTLLIPPKVQARLQKLEAANQKLGDEVLRRREAESALRRSERHQKLMLEEAKQVQVQMRDLSRRLLDAQEEERRHVSRELHDNVLQTLVGINVHLEALNREAQSDLSHLKSRIAQAQHIVEDAVRAIHRFARALRPMILDDLGLLPALHSQFADFQKRTPIVVQFTCCPEAEQLSNARCTVIYRVVQSALSNVEHHSSARRVKVSIQAKAKTIILKVHDNGRSFDVRRTLDAKCYKRLGLLGMRERVEMVNGIFGIKSAPSRGTTVQAEFPLEANAKNRLMFTKMTPPLI